jgi:hypothetical protein
MRSETIFRIDNEVVLIEDGKLEIEVLETIKFMLSEECEVDFNDIEVEFVKGDDDLSDLEVNFEGKLIHYLTYKEINKVEFEGDLDDFLNFFNKNTINLNENKLFLLN